MPRIFPTAQDVENAFYEALERGDLEAMMAVWTDDEEIVCVHPGGARLSGHDQVRESWRRIFAGPAMRVEITRQAAINAMMAAVHTLHETVTLVGDNPMRATVLATNVYLRSAAGWRLVVHHASPLPGPEQAPHEAPKILH